MPTAVKTGKKKSRLSASLAAALALGATVPDDLKELETDDVETPPVNPENKDELKDEKPPVVDTPENKDELKDTKPDTPPSNPEQATADLTAAQTRVTELTAEVTSLTEKLTAQKGVTDHIQGQLTTANTSLARAQVELEAEKKKVEDKDKSITSLRAVVLQSTQRLGIAMSMQIVGLENMSDENLVAQFSKLNEDFEKKYKVGKQHSDDSDIREEKSKSADNVASAATRATQPAKKR